MIVNVGKWHVALLLLIESSRTRVKDLKSSLLTLRSNWYITLNTVFPNLQVGHILKVFEKKEVFWFPLHLPRSKSNCFTTLKLSQIYLKSSGKLFGRLSWGSIVFVVHSDFQVLEQLIIYSQAFSNVSNF